MTPPRGAAHWQSGERLRAWVAMTSDGVLAAHGDLLGGKMRIGGQLQFSVLPDGRLPRDGVAPRAFSVPIESERRL